MQSAARNKRCTLYKDILIPTLSTSTQAIKNIFSGTHRNFENLGTVSKNTWYNKPTDKNILLSWQQEPYYNQIANQNQNHDGYLFWLSTNQQGETPWWELWVLAKERNKENNFVHSWFVVESPCYVPRQNCVIFSENIKNSGREGFQCSWYQYHWTLNNTENATLR